MGATEPANLRDAFATLARSLKRMSVYRHAAHEHRSYLEAPLAALSSLLAREQSITVAVEPGALRFRDEIVYTEPPRELSLCFRLHKDGVRTLTFRNGLSLDELLAFANVAVAEPAGGGAREDAVTELWKLDLQHLAYTATSGYRMDEAGGAAMSKNVADVTARAKETIERHVGANFVEATQLPALWPVEKRNLRDQQDWTGLARRAALTILRIVDQDHAGWDLEALEETFWRLLDEMAARGEAQAMATALERARTIEGPHALKFRAAVGRNLAEPRRLELAVKLSGTDRPQLLTAWLALLPPDAGPVVVEMIPLATNAGARALLGAAAIARFDSCAAQIESSLRQGTVQVAKAMLAAPMVPARRAALAIFAVSNPDLDVKREAIPSLPADDSTARLLGGLLPSRSRELRLAATLALGGFAQLADVAAAQIMAAMARAQFSTFDREERAAAHRALGKLASTSGFSFLVDRLARPARGLFRRRNVDADQLLAVQGLAEEASQRSLRALEDALLPSYRNGAAVTAACRAAAQHVRMSVRGGKSA